MSSGFDLLAGVGFLLDIGVLVSNPVKIGFLVNVGLVIGWLELL